MHISLCPATSIAGRGTELQLQSAGCDKVCLTAGQAVQVVSRLPAKKQRACIGVSTDSVPRKASVSVCQMNRDLTLTCRAASS